MSDYETNNIIEHAFT